MKRQRHSFTLTSEFKLEAAVLILDQRYLTPEAFKLLNGGKSTLYKSQATGA